MKSTFNTFLFAVIVLLGTSGNSRTWDFRPMGVELEYAGQGGTLKITPNEGYLSLLRFVQDHFKGDDAQLRDWIRYGYPIGAQFAFFTDDQNRRWQVAPEFMSPKIVDGYELVTPPLKSFAEFQKLAVVLDDIKASGLFIPGRSSATHLTADVSDLVQNNVGLDDFVNLILFIENHIIEIYHIFQPARYGLTMNGYSVPLSFNQRSLLYELAALPKDQRDLESVRALFLKYQDHEVALSEDKLIKQWKFRAFNYAKFLQLGIFTEPNRFVVENRLPDLADGEMILKFQKAFESIIEVGSKTKSNRFKDPFKAIKPDSSLKSASQFIINGLDLNRYADFITSLGLDLKDYPPYPERIKTRQPYFPVCSRYL